jgi:hypothetical protein
MAFKGDEDHSIKIDEAIQLTSNYRKSATPGSVQGGFFGKLAIQEILEQDKCVGIRIYYGREDDGTPTFVVVGVEENEDDLVDGKIAEQPIPCPPRCGSSNALNS